MLAAMRQHSRSLLIYVLFGVIIAVFIINFGPGSQGGCMGNVSQSYAAKVGPNAVHEQEFVRAMQIFGVNEGGSGGAERMRAVRQYLMDAFIGREIWAREAEALGFRVSDAEASERLAQGVLLVAGQPWRADRHPAFASIWKNGFDYARWKSVFCEGFLRTSPKRLIESQKRELLAEKARQLMFTSVKLSPEEVKRSYAERETQVKLAYVRFSPREYEDATISPAEIAAYLDSHKGAVKAEYEASSFRYKGTPKQAHLRLVVVKKGGDEAEAKAKSARARVAGGEDFAAVARETNEDKSLKDKGGDVGWKVKGQSGQGEAFDEKIFALAAGQLSEVIKVEGGFAFAKVEAYREGDLPLPQVEKEIAEELVRKERAATKAKQEAEAAMAKVKAGATLEQLYPKKPEDTDDAQAGAAAPRAIKETGLFSRRGNVIEEVGITKEGADQAFGKMKKGEVAGPFKIEDGAGTYVLLSLVERKDPNWPDFEKNKEEIARRFAAEKGASVLASFTQTRCNDARQEGKIQVNPAVFAVGDGEAAPYVPCLGLGFR